MNALTSTLLWMSLQVALFSLLGVAAFALLKRRGPTTAVAISAIVLGLTLPLALLIASPWPRWQLPAADAAKSPAIALTNNHTVNNSAPLTASPFDDQTISSPDTADAPSPLSIWWQNTLDWLRPTPKPAATIASHWPAWFGYLPFVLLGGVVVCLARLALAMWAVRKYRDQSKPIADDALLSAANRLAKEIGAPLAELRETTALRSAATIGWRKPLLLLPAEWRSWTPLEQRVVLAHELAHVARQDYLTGLVARLAAAIHFYQPAVLWLGRQLRIQQELAADARAAAVAGSRQTYLTTLAEMALRADETPLPWAARAFLPNTSLLVKRVKWLKRKGTSMEKTFSRSARWMLVAAMATVALAVAGIRGPGEGNSSSALAADEGKQVTGSGGEAAKPQAAKSGIEMLAQNAPNQNGGEKAPQKFEFKYAAPDEKQIRTFDFVPADANLVLAASPSELAKIPAVSKAFEAVFDHGFLHRHGLKFAELQNVIVCNFDLDPQRKFDRIVLQTVAPFDWVKALKDDYSSMQSRQTSGKEYFVVSDPKQVEPTIGPCFYCPDSRTVVAGSEEEIKKLLAGEKIMDFKMFPEFMSNPVCEYANVVALKKLMVLDLNGNALQADPMLALAMPLIEHVKIVRGAASAPDLKAPNRLSAASIFECDSDVGAKQVGATIEAARTIAANLLQAKQLAWSKELAPHVPQEQIVAINGFINALIKSLIDATVPVNDKYAAVNINLDVDSATLAAFFMPAVAAAKEAEMRNQTMTHLKELALAMHVYNMKNGTFPASAIRDANGKPLLSWRVAILPFLGAHELALYKQFHLDQPWDSDANKALLAKMPDVFRDPHDPEGTTNASYYMPTGKGMFGGSETGTRIKDITDGTVNTIMLVEAKRDIPWTKPEDIEIPDDPAKLIEKLGGHIPNEAGGLILAAFADGHVDCLSNGIDPKFLRGMFTISGGEPAAVQIGPAEKPQSPGRVVPLPTGVPGAHDNGSNPSDNSDKQPIATQKEGNSGANRSHENVDEILSRDVKLKDLNEQLHSLEIKLQQFAPTIKDPEVDPTAKKLRLMIEFTKARIEQRRQELQTKNSADKNSSDNGSSKLEIHRGETEPAEGLVETQIGDAKVYMHPEVELTEADFASAKVDTDAKGVSIVKIETTVEGAAKMQKLTEQNLMKRLIIVIDGKAVMAPRIQSAISKSLEINGHFTFDEAERIASAVGAK
ncbi:MAG TPA: M56 family metallopeptidase [Pirellulales bacterium]|jgi:beta-lactamase regulating signal transducer with metallopeptidase domain